MAQATLLNSIVLGNFIDLLDDDVTRPPEATSANNLIGGRPGAPTVNDVFAQYDGIREILTDNGGPVETIALRAHVDNPALDVGDDASPHADATGQTRFDQEFVGTGAADLGSLELRTQVHVPVHIRGMDGLVVGYGNDNTLAGRAGDDTFSGGAGTDTALFDGDHDGFALAVTTARARSLCATRMARTATRARTR